MYWMTFPWPWPKVTSVTLIKKSELCLHGTVRTNHPITTKLGSYIPLVVLITWLDFGGILLELFGCVLTRSNTIGFIWNGWFDWWETKMKCIGWILDEKGDFGLWSRPWLWPWSNFEIAVSRDMLFWLMWKQKDVNQLITGLTAWPRPLTTCTMTFTLKFQCQSL